MSRSILRLVRNVSLLAFMTCLLCAAEALRAQSPVSGVVSMETKPLPSEPQSRSDFSVLTDSTKDLAQDRSAASQTICKDCELQNATLADPSAVAPTTTPSTLQNASHPGVFAGENANLAVDLVADRMLLRTAPNSGTIITNPVAGQSYYIHLEWRNTGTTSTSAFRVELKFNGAILCAGDITAAANTSSVVWCSGAVTWPSGTVTIQGTLDVNNVIVETNESNNSASATYGGSSQADLVADRMLLKPGPNTGTEVTAPVAGQQYYVHMEWRNTGTVAANNFQVELRLNGTAVCAGAISGGANSSNIVWCGPLTWPSGTNTISGVLDVTNLVTESNESNNTATRSYTSNAQADLVADRMLLKPGQNTGTEVTAPVAGQQYYVHLEWRNTGTVAANNFQAELRLNGTAVCAGAISGGANSSNIVWCGGPVTWPSGSNNISGVLDVTSIIAESNESNNSTTRTYQPASPPDIRVVPTSLTINQSNNAASRVAPRRSAIDLSLAHTPQRLLIKFREAVRVDARTLATTSPSVNVLNARYQVRNVRAVFAGAGGDLALKQQMGLLNIYAVELAPTASLLDALQAYNVLPEVEYAEPDYILRAFGELSVPHAAARTVSQSRAHSAGAIQLAPNDPLYPKQWGLKNTGQAEPFGGGAPVGTPGVDINAEAAWNLQTGSSSVIVAVLDDGLDLAHPEFAGRILPGFDFVDNDNDVRPPGNNAHGTACAGIIAAAGNNNLGVAGVAWNVKIMMGRVLNASGSGSNTNIAAAVQWAADQGADIISMSLGGTGFSQVLEDAVNYAHNRDVLVMAAAGNSNTSLAHYPAAYANCVSVGALSPCDGRKRSSSNIFEVNPGVTPDPRGVTCDNEKWWGSNYSSGLDFLTPGTRIYTTDITGGAGYDPGDYASTFNGTSSACPYAAGVAALVRSENPSLTNAQVWALLQSTAVDLETPGYDEDTGYGRLDAHQALLAASGGAASGSFTVFNDGGSTLNVSNITFDKNWLTISATNFTVAGGGSRVVNVTVDWNLVGSTSQTGTLTILSNDPDEASVTISVTANPTPPPPASITVQTPLGGAVWNVNATETVTWNSVNVSGNVNIKLSTDGGSTYPITLVSNTANDGTQSLTVPNNPSTNARVRVESVANTTIFGVNPGNFTIQSPPTQSVNVTSPAAGATWLIGSMQNVMWMSQNVSGNVNIKLSTDGGGSFPITLAANTANDGTQSITVPNNPSTTARVRVESVSNSNIFGLNPGNFIIADSPTACDPADCNVPAIFPVAKGVNVLGQTITAKDGDTVCVDIRLKENAQPIDAFGFKLQVDPDQLTFVRVEKGNLTAGFITVSAQENPAGSGTFTCGGFGLTAIPANSAGVIMRLCFIVNCNSVAMSDLVLSAPIDDLAGFATCCNLFECVTCLHDGDVNGDLTLTPGDALCAFQIYLNNGTVPGTCDAANFECELIASDVNCDNTTTPGDALAIFSRYLQNLPPLDCFARTNAASASSQPYQLAMETRTLVSAGEQRELVKLVLRVANPQSLQALGLQLQYPGDALELLGVARGTLTSDWVQLEGRQLENGTVRIGGFHSKAIATNLAGELLEVIFASKGRSVTRSEFSLSELTDDFKNARVEGTATSVTANASTPAVFKLHQSYPNPFKSGAHGSEMIIRFDLPGAIAQSVELSIYNLAGQLVRRLVSGERAPGAYEVRWDGNNEHGQQVPSGTYLYRLKAGKFSESKQLTIVR